MNIRDKIKNIKSVFKKKEPDMIPLTGGTVNNDIKQLQVAEDITKIDMNVAYNQPKTYDKTVNYNVWLTLNFHAEYFANYFKIHCDDAEVFSTIIKVFKGYFYHGNVGIYIVNNKLIPVYEVTSEINSSGEKVWIKVGYLNELFSGNIEHIFREPKNTFKITRNMMDNYIPLSGGMSAYIKWLPFAKLQTQLLTMINNHRYFNHKVLAIKCKDASALRKEMDAYYNLDFPFILNLGSTTDTNTNNFIDINQTENANEKILSYYDTVTKIYYELLGRRKNTDFKKERNITAEVEASQSNFDILLNNEKKYKELFLKKLSEKINKDIYIIDTEEELEKNNNNEVKKLDKRQSVSLKYH